MKKAAQYSDRDRKKQNAIRKSDRIVSVGV